MVGAAYDDTGGTNKGALYVIQLLRDGSVDQFQKISSETGDFTFRLDNRDHFGSAVSSLSDYNGDQTTDVAVGAYQDDVSEVCCDLHFLLNVMFLS